MSTFLRVLSALGVEKKIYGCQESFVGWPTNKNEYVADIKPLKIKMIMLKRKILKLSLSLRPRKAAKSRYLNSFNGQMKANPKLM